MFQFQTGAIKSYGANTVGEDREVSIPNWFD